MGNTSKLYYTDTTFICNKLGEDLASYNPQVKNKSLGFIFKLEK